MVISAVKVSGLRQPGPKTFAAIYRIFGADYMRKTGSL